MPTPPAEESAELTARLAARYSASARDYARLWGPVIRPIGEQLLRSLPLAEAQRVLDVATGVGGLMPAIRAAAPNATVVGVDRAEGMLRVAQEQVRVPMAMMDAQLLGVRSESVDVVVLAFCLFRLFEPLRGLTEARLVLRPGGAVGATTWGTEQPSAAVDLWNRELDAWGAEANPDPIIERQPMLDTPSKLRHLFETAGFAEVRAWAERFERRWTLDEFLTIRAFCGRSQQRFETLDPTRHVDFLAHVRQKLSALPPEALFYRPEVVFAVGRRP